MGLSVLDSKGEDLVVGDLVAWQATSHGARRPVKKAMVTQIKAVPNDYTWEITISARFDNGAVDCAKTFIQKDLSVASFSNVTKL